MTLFSAPTLCLSFSFIPRLRPPSTSLPAKSANSHADLSLDRWSRAKSVYSHTARNKTSRCLQSRRSPRPPPHKSPWHRNRPDRRKRRRHRTPSNTLTDSITHSPSVANLPSFGFCCLLTWLCLSSSFSASSALRYCCVSELYRGAQTQTLFLPSLNVSGFFKAKNKPRIYFPSILLLRNPSLKICRFFILDTASHSGLSCFLIWVKNLMYCFF